MKIDCTKAPFYSYLGHAWSVFANVSKFTMLAKIPYLSCTIYKQVASLKCQKGHMVNGCIVGGRRCAISLDLQKIKWYVGLSDGKDVSLSLSFLQLNAYMQFSSKFAFFSIFEKTCQSCQLAQLRQRQ